MTCAVTSTGSLASNLYMTGSCLLNRGKNIFINSFIATSALHSASNIVGAVASFILIKHQMRGKCDQPKFPKQKVIKKIALGSLAATATFVSCLAITKVFSIIYGRRTQHTNYNNDFQQFSGLGLLVPLSTNLLSSCIEAAFKRKELKFLSDKYPSENKCICIQGLLTGLSSLFLSSRSYHGVLPRLNTVVNNGLFGMTVAKISTITGDLWSSTSAIFTNKLLSSLFL